MHESLKLERLIREEELGDNMRDRARRKACEAISEGNTLKVETWAVPVRNKTGKKRVEQGVERMRKPEDAAQPEQVTLV
jgi:hypothetical protein